MNVTVQTDNLDHENVHQSDGCYSLIGQLADNLQTAAVASILV